MVCPVLMQCGAAMTIPEEAVRAGDSNWHVFAHAAHGAAGAASRDDAAVERLLEALKAVEPGDAQKMLEFTIGEGEKAMRKTTVSAVLRDEKRAADEEIRQRDIEIMRLPRFMQERTMTGAQIGTAFHRAMCMIDLAKLRGVPSIAAAVEKEMERLLLAGILTRQEYEAVPPKMLTDFFASPAGVRLLASGEIHREWAFTYRREHEGQTQLVQGVIDCCFVEDGQWVLIDYKTDRDAAGAVERHRGQLNLYADALSSITGMPVSDCILHLVRLGVGYSVSCNLC
jgi:ATP-dependent exoDNAse (exonuclease V) beta subunit